MKKTKGYAMGGAMKTTKGYAQGGKMKMVKDPDSGKILPEFAADGKGKMAKGGMTKSTPMKKMAGGEMKPTKTMKEGGMTKKTKGMAAGGMTKKTKASSMGGVARGMGAAPNALAFFLT